MRLRLLLLCASILGACAVEPNPPPVVPPDDEPSDPDLGGPPYPVVLAHGMFGQENYLGILDYWSTIPDALAAAGNEVFVTEVDPRDRHVRITSLRTRVTRFDERDWSARWYAWLALNEFVSGEWTTWANGVEPDLRHALPDDSGPEIDDLVRAAQNERPAAMGEILSQDVEFISDFMAVLSITPGSQSVGNTPARTNEDLPTPLLPNTSTNGQPAVACCRRAQSTSLAAAVRPK